ncbi:RICIN domain-containing protein [Superficieibacter sp. BNK-5]|uniref:RICIN domain-containing protein n=1 Tax=Superficieibacter sp. BNK-5 TaxID=3376142 RepID=UPI0039BFA2DB
MIGMFKYAACPTMVLGVSDQQTGAPLALRKIESELRKILWSVNEKTGEISLVASDSLLVDISGNRIVLQQRDAGKLSQKWDMATTRGFIRSKQSSSNVIDSYNRGTGEGNAIILYPYNGSEAQQWKFVPMDMMTLNNITEEMMAEDEPSHA